MFYVLKFEMIECMQVDIDVVTGETRILATDMMYDCGKSLNPAINIGQFGHFYPFDGPSKDYVASIRQFPHCINYVQSCQSTTESTLLVATFAWCQGQAHIRQHVNLRNSNRWQHPQTINVEFFNGPVYEDHVLSSKSKFLSSNL